MYQSLCVTLGSLPKPTKVYCGHEVLLTLSVSVSPSISQVSYPAQLLLSHLYLSISLIPLTGYHFSHSSSYISLPLPTQLNIPFLSDLHFSISSSFLPLNLISHLAYLIYISYDHLPHPAQLSSLMLSFLSQFKNSLFLLRSFSTCLTSSPYDSHRISQPVQVPLLLISLLNQLKFFLFLSFN